MTACASDNELVAAAARGDTAALAGLYDRYSPALLAVGLRIVGDRPAAEDLVHDVFLEAWRKAREFDAGRGTVRTWLLVRMRSRSLDFRRSAGRSRHVSSETDEPVSETPAAPEEDPALGPDRSAVRRALEDLPPAQRAVLELAYFEGLSSSEAAARLGVPVGTVKSRVAAGLARLRAALRGSEGVSSESVSSGGVSSGGVSSEGSR